MWNSAKANTLLLVLTMCVILSQLTHGGKKSPYELLGVQKNASDREIKKAFRKLSLQYHPDKNKDPNAENIFREIAEAYTILSDPEKRRRFDQFGYEDEANHGGGGSYGGGQQFHFNMHDFFKNFDDAFHHQAKGHHDHHHHQQHHHSFGGFNFDDIFEGMDSDEFDFFNHPHGSPFGGVEDFAHTFGDGNSFFGSHMSESSSFSFSSSSQGNCRTVTKRSGNTVYTHTECS